MPNWFKTSEAHHAHLEIRRDARAYWAMKHRTPVRWPQALDEYLLAIGVEEKDLPEYYLSSKDTITKFEVKQDCHRKVRCPDCGHWLNYDRVSPCRMVNPKGYTGIFWCGKDKEEDDHSCTYHCYVLDGYIDTLNKVVQGKFEEIVKVVNR